jgi:hypothetical protein
MATFEESNYLEQTSDVNELLRAVHIALPLVTHEDIRTYLISVMNQFKTKRTVSALGLDEVITKANDAGILIDLGTAKTILEKAASDIDLNYATSCIQYHIDEFISSSGQGMYGKGSPLFIRKGVFEQLPSKVTPAYTIDFDADLYLDEQALDWGDDAANALAKKWIADIGTLSNQSVDYLQDKLTQGLYLEMDSLLIELSELAQDHSYFVYWSDSMFNLYYSTNISNAYQPLEILKMIGAI